MKLKIAVVGTGCVARDNYLPFLSRQPDVELLYYTRTRSRAEECAGKFGGRVCGSPEELLAADPDAVLVLTKETQRREAAAALLEHRPRRLFFEKPLVAAAGQARVAEEDFFAGRELLRRAAAAGAETAMVFNYRFFEQTQRARRIVGEREFGRLLHVAGLVHYACWSHCIDLVLWFGGPPAEMSAVSPEAERGDMKCRDVAAAFRLEGGAAGTVLGSSAMPFKGPLFELTLGFERGRVHFRDLDGEMEVVDYRGPHHERYALAANWSRWDHYRASFDKAVGAYLESIRKGRPPPVPGRAGLEELQFEAALGRSVAQGRRVSVQEEFPLEA